jgi:hypothetical protein
MARVTYGSGVTEYKGSIGGITYQRNASGPVAKLRSIWIVNPSHSQSFYQRNLAYLVSYWPTLSQANKNAWDAFSAAHDHTTPWGDSKTLSGFQWFLSVNLNRMVYYTTPIETPPTWFSFSPPDSFTLVATSTYLRCEWSSTWTPDGWPRIYLTLPLRQSSLKLRRSLFYITFGSWQAPLDTLDLTSYFETLANVTWSAFYESSNCSIICRLQDCGLSTGLGSAFTSAIVKIG